MDTIFANPGEDRYFEDYVPASTHEFGPILVEPGEVSPLGYARSQKISTLA